METTSIDWAAHMAAYEGSGQTVAEYCVAKGLPLKAFRSERYKTTRNTYKKRRRKTSPSNFQEILSKDTEYKITVDGSGCASLSGIPATALPAVMKVIFALPK